MAYIRVMRSWNGEKLKDRRFGKPNPLPLLAYTTWDEWLHLFTANHASALWRQALPFFSTVPNWVIQAAKPWTFKVLLWDLGLTPCAILATAVLMWTLSVHQSCTSRHRQAHISALKERKGQKNDCWERWVKRLKNRRNKYLTLKVSGTNRIPLDLRACFGN